MTNQDQTSEIAARLIGLQEAVTEQERTTNRMQAQLKWELDKYAKSRFAEHFPIGSQWKMKMLVYRTGEYALRTVTVCGYRAIIDERVAEVRAYIEITHGNSPARRLAEPRNLQLVEA